VRRPRAIVDRVATRVSRSILVDGPPATVFAYLHDPEARGRWDAMTDLVQLEGERPAPGVRVRFRGRRTAPSWVGEITAYEPPRRSVVRLVDGVGMPFDDFVQTITVQPGQGLTRVTFVLEYAPRGLMRVLDGVTVRPRMERAAMRSLRAVADHFA
jgi:uncharacterized protein YndB with AHSA1/START domain